MPLATQAGKPKVRSVERRSAGFPACGFAELSSSAIFSAATNWGLESPQNPQTRMSALLPRPAQVACARPSPNASADALGRRRN